ncbi:protein kinase-like domain, concanavalin A-like lectin/glucanase domain protein [Tanacetum coccineum]
MAEVSAIIEEATRTWMTPIQEYIKKRILPEDATEARTIREKARNYTIEEGILYRKSYLRPLLRCIGPQQAKYLIKEIHMGSCGMHDGPRRAVHKAISVRYFWPSMHRDANNEISNCDSFQGYATWGMDIVGPLPEALAKIKYLIVAIDYFTKWFGVPATIITDNGTHLINDPFKSWAEGLRIKLVSTLVYHPQANRAVEQANRSIMQGIKTSTQAEVKPARRAERDSDNQGSNTKIENGKVLQSTSPSQAIQEPGDGVTNSTRCRHNPLSDGVTTFHDGISMEFLDPKKKEEIESWLKDSRIVDSFDVANEIEYFDTFPTLEELEYHEWLLKYPKPSWVKAKIRTGNLNNIKISCKIGHFLKRQAYIDLESPINVVSKQHYNKIMIKGLESRQKPSNPSKNNNFVGRVKGLEVFIGNFTYECNFMILEDTTSIIDHHLGDVVFRKPFTRNTGLVYDQKKGMVTFEKHEEKITFIMPHKMIVFKDINTDSIPPSVLKSNDDRGKTYYSNRLTLGPEYREDESISKEIRHLMKLEREAKRHKGEVV